LTPSLRLFLLLPIITLSQENLEHPRHVER
jgi:hypothetical protein